MALINDGWGGKTTTLAKPKNNPNSPFANPNAIFAAHSAATQAAQARTVYTPPAASRSSGSTTRSTSSGTSSSTTARSSSGSSGGSYASGYAAAQAKADKEKADREKKQNDATTQQVDALKKMLDSTFSQARDTKITNIQNVLKQQDASVLSDYGKRADQLFGSDADNQKSEADASYANLANRARESGDILAQALSQGAGESDTLRAQLMAMRNWSSNQSDVNRSYFDTARSIRNSLVDLNADTRTSRMNLANKANSDLQQVWNDYYGQVADTWTQIGNLEGSNTNESYKKKYADAFDKAASAAGDSWKSPGIDKSVTDWTGQQMADATLNNTQLGLTGRQIGQQKKPEGATLRKW